MATSRTLEPPSRWMKPVGPTGGLRGEITNEVTPDGPYLDGPDALVAAVGRELDASVVSGDAALTHCETKKIVDGEAYRY